MLFLESSEVIFRVALALLEEHQDQLLACDSFEEIMEYLKVIKTYFLIFLYKFFITISNKFINFFSQIKVPAVDKETLDRVMKRVFYPDVEMAKQLNEYRVEYQVLQEEMLSVKPQIENMEKLEFENKELTRQNVRLSEQLEVCKMYILNCTKFFFYDKSVFCYELIFVVTLKLVKFKKLYKKNYSLKNLKYCTI